MEDNINEIAKRMTRSEFIEEFLDGGDCPSYYSLYEPEECDHIGCKQCVKESVKDIKFKGEDETIAAICIDSGTGLALTKNKKYTVKESKYTNFYDLINDKGEEDSYLKSRFRILEGEKVEDKIIRVRCINKECRNLTFKKEYKVLKEWEEKSKMKPCETYRVYLLIDDSGNESEEPCCLFEKVEDVLMVECIDNSDLDNGILTEANQYKVIENNGITYVVVNDSGEKGSYLKARFKQVEPQNKVEEENRCYNEGCQHIKDNQCYILKTTSCPICLKEPLNYKEEYKKLKEELQLADFNVGKYIKENSDLKEFKNKYKRMENQFNNNSKVLEDYSTKITILEADNKEYKKANEGLAAESKERAATIKKLQRIIEDNTENAILSNRVEDLENEIKQHEKDKKIVCDKNFELISENMELKRLHENQRLNIKDEMSENRELKAKVVELEKDNKYKKEEILQYEELTGEYRKENEELKKQNNQGYMEQMNITLNEKNKIIERLGNSTKEYYYNWLESQKEIGNEKDKNRLLIDKVEALKEAVINLTELI